MQLEALQPPKQRLEIPLLLAGEGFFSSFFFFSNHHLISSMSGVEKKKKTGGKVMKSQFGPGGEKWTIGCGRVRRQAVDTVSHK